MKTYRLHNPHFKVLSGTQQGEQNLHGFCKDSHQYILPYKKIRRKLSFKRLITKGLRENIITYWRMIYHPPSAKTGVNE